MRIRDFLDSPEAIGAVMVALGRMRPDDIPYASSPERAAQMGLRVSHEVAGIAVGLLDANEQAAHVSMWMLAQRDEVAASREGRRQMELAAGIADRVPVILFAESIHGTGVITQWAVAKRVRGSRN